MEGNKKAILVACFGWYQERLVYIDEYLKKHGYETHILLSDFCHGSKRKDTKFSNISNIQYIPTKEYQRNLSIKRLSSHADFSHKVRHIVEEKKPDLVYSLIPPNSLTKDLATLKTGGGGVPAGARYHRFVA